MAGFGTFTTTSYLFDAAKKFLFCHNTAYLYPSMAGTPISYKSSLLRSINLTLLKMIKCVYVVRVFTYRNLFTSSKFLW